MPRLFAGNFSFEQGLLPGHQPSRTITRFEAELACIWLAVARDGDEVLCGGVISEEEQSRLAELCSVQPKFLSPDQLDQSRATELVPWGWTPGIRQLADRLRISIVAPEQETIRTVNSRVFGYELCRELNVRIPGESVVRSLPELMPAIQNAHAESGGWIIKPNQGQAGRGQLRGETPFLAEQQLATILHRLSKQEAVLVEPKLNRILEIGVQWRIHQGGDFELDGITQLLTDDRGRYLGTAIHPGEVHGIEVEAMNECLRIQSRAIERIAALGYFGPVGIDAMLFRDGESERIRPIQDINARWTMGRIGWEWGQKWGPGKWLHSEMCPAVTPSLEQLPLALSPAELDGSPVRCRTWWVS
ncbi:MAG TPA: hypothetical protein VNQ76_21805 [Planctomicrobium sp.]|nr:hypothetical protein [Planctomicrobium sp.]